MAAAPGSIQQLQQESIQHLAAGRFAEAAPLLEQLVQLTPGDKNRWHELGVARLFLGDHGAAERHFDHARALGADDSPFLFNQALLFDAQNRPRDAIANLRVIVTRNPDDLSSWRMISKSLSKLRPDESTDADKAQLLESLANTIRLAPSDREAYWTYCYSSVPDSEIRRLLADLDARLDATPDDADLLFCKGTCLQRLNQPQAAADIARAGVAKAPENAQMRHLLHESLMHAQDYQAGAEIAQDSLEKFPNTPQIIKHAVDSLLADDKAAIALPYISDAVNKFPDNHDLAVSYLRTLMRHRRHQEVIDIGGAMLNRFPDSMDIHLAISRSHFMLRQMAEGSRKNRWMARKPYFTYAAYHNTALPEWDGGSLEGKSIVVFGNSSIGDEPLFYRFLQNVVRAAGHVTIVTHPRLVEFFRYIFPTVEILTYDMPAETLPNAAAVVERHDLKVLADTLPGYFAESEADFAKAPERWLSVDPALTKELARQAEAVAGEGEFRIGVVWLTSNPALRAVREMPLEGFKRFSDLPVKWFNLQHALLGNALETCAEDMGLELLSVEGANPDGDVASFAALIQSMDVILAIDTSLLTIAAGLGVPSIVMLAWAPTDYVYTDDGDTTPWLPGATMYRQPTHGDWETVLTGVRQDIINRLKQRGIAVPNEPV